MGREKEEQNKTPSTSGPQLTITTAIPTVREDRDGEDWRRKDERQIGWMMRFQVGMASRSIRSLIVERMKSMVGGLGGGARSNISAVLGKGIEKMVQYIKNEHLKFLPIVYHWFIV